MSRSKLARLAVTGLSLALPASSFADPPQEVKADASRITARPGLFKALREPPCSYVSTQHRKGFVRHGDRVVSWIRGRHNGGAIPLRHFLSGPRVINDTYGLFFYDPDGGYVTVYKKDYGYEFHGWRRGVMVVRSRDGTLWSALTGRAIEGPEKGRRLERTPNLLTTWGHWLMLHPESTAYNLFDGKRYAITELPRKMTEDARKSMGQVDRRLEPLTPVFGVEEGKDRRVFPLEGVGERACFTDVVDGVPIAVFWYGPTRSAVAFRSELDGRKLSFYADDIAPETAPFMDRETKSRWTLAGRAVDGPLKGKELRWVAGVACRWYAWIAEYPGTGIHGEIHGKVIHGKPTVGKATDGKGRENKRKDR
ncbi:MAG: DUF3179 domain-containing (seleno)protein [Planctomycetota bacterium]|nr:DUF3179 domain-containing (seleno)protein [Planctomycetota bacterium]